MAKRNRQYRASRQMRHTNDQALLTAIDFYETFGEPERAAELREQRRHAINSARGLYSKPYDKDAGYGQTKPQNADRVRARKLRGVTKWVEGKATVSYVKSGYAWVNGERVKVDPKATGITQSFSYSRAQEREDKHASDHPGKGRPKRNGDRPRSARSKAKALAREQYERVKPINAARLKALKADRQASRLARAQRQAVSY